ncbi:MAG: DNA mismatch repair protein MutL [Planctomycetota bacterium]|jgi:DNA mismatch repair protein MutL
MSPTVEPARIAVLAEVVKNQIAAGEVIERPASVVKELIENSLDAGAKEVRLDLEEGGVRLIRVTDDGIGMNAADLELAFTAHATSKLRSPEDLEHIASLGFRGEALASVGSVARCSIFSRQGADSLGRKIQNEGGTITEAREAGGPAGTIVEVRDLFYNTPARRRFMKRTSTELAHCLGVVQRLALAHPGVGFVVTHDGKRAFDVEAEMDFRARIRRTFGADLAESLVAVEAQDGDARLSGFVAPPRFSRRDTSRQLWFLNGRSVRDKVLIRVLRESYRGFLVEGRQPVAFLQLSLDPARVDVNVHPAKSEVRFRDQRKLFGFLVNALRDAVKMTDMATPGESLITTMRRREEREGTALPDPGPMTRRAPTLGSEVREVEGRPFDPDNFTLPRPEGQEGAPGGVTVAWEDGSRTAFPAEATAVGQVGAEAGAEVSEGSEEWAARDQISGPFLQIDKTYIVRGMPDGFEIIDQHALHERLTFELLRRDVRAGAVEVQRLLVPEIVDVSMADAELLEGHIDSFASIGIEISRFGEKTIAVQGLPVRLRHPDAEGLVADLVEVIGRTGKAPEAEDVIEEVLHSAACRSSVMAGDQLSEVEIQSLLERARALGETDQTCPHSRPTRVRFSIEDLERAFHRR